MIRISTYIKRRLRIGFWTLALILSFLILASPNASAQAATCKAPVLKSIKNMDTGIRLAWKADPGAAAYRVYRKLPRGEWKAIAETTKAYYKDKTAETGKKYTYTVRCLNSKRKLCSSYNKKGLTIIRLDLPGAPTAENTENRVMMVRWPKNKGITGYELRIAENPELENPSELVIKKNSRSYLRVTGLKMKKTYYVQYRTYKTDDDITYFSPWSIIAHTRITMTQAKTYKNMSESDIIELVGPLCTQNQLDTGILASVTMAQFILESGYGKSELCQQANNCFGMKAELSGNTWPGSTWNQKSIYTKETGEDDEEGNTYRIIADFRKYPCIEDSIADHSAYLLGATRDGVNPRYPGLAWEPDYRTAIQIIKDGGYATSVDYVDSLCRVIERWDLTRFDVVY